MLGARELQGARVLQSTRELQGVPVLQSTHELQVKRVCRTRGRDAYYPPSGKKRRSTVNQKKTPGKGCKIQNYSSIQKYKQTKYMKIMIKKKKKHREKIKQNKTETYEKPSQ